MRFTLNCLKASFIQFSRIPLNGTPLTPEHFALSVNYLPIVGLFVGLCSAILGFFLLIFLPPVPVAVCMITLAIALTGAIHEDGLADSCDGLFGGYNKDRRLHIMKDSTIGVYAALGLFCVLSLKISLLASMPTATMLSAFISAQALSRLAPLIVIALSTYSGVATASKMTASIQLKKQALLSVTCLISLFIFYLMPIVFILLSFACILAISVIGKIIFDKKIDGYNGDCLGATQQISECALLMLSIAFI